MHSDQPFRIQNAQIDAQGNIMIVRLHDEMSYEVTQPHEEPCLVLHIPFREHPERKTEAVQHSPFRSKKIRSVSARSSVGARPRRDRSLDGSARFQFLRSARERIEAYEKAASPRTRLLIASGRFLGNFTAVFLFLFVSLNAASFWEVTRARLLPEEGMRERRALEKVISPLSREQLLSVPELPTAGRHADAAVTAMLTVAPPDNRLIIPEIGKNVRIVEATDAALRREDWKTFEKDIQDALRFGIVRYPGTAKPGEPGNVFMTGHSAYLPWDSGRYKEVFARLGDLEPGDEYSIYYEGKLHRYRIVRKFEVQPKDISVLEQPSDRYMSTLMTCVPIGTTLRRLIVQGEEMDRLTGEAREVANGTEVQELKQKQKLGEALPGWGNGLPI